MKVFKVTRTDEDQGYDTFDSFVVVATDKKRAKEIVPEHEPWPISGEKWKVKTFEDHKDDPYLSYTWISAEQKDTLEVEYIGKAKGPERYILCSFNAG